MSEITTHEQNVATRTIDFDFDFKGNINGIEVIKTKGDGDVSTTKDRGTWASVRANLQFLLDQRKVRLKLCYKVEECQGDQTVLYFDAMKEYSFEDFYNVGVFDRYENNGRVHKTSIPTDIEIVGSYGDAYVMSSFVGEHHEYMKPTPWNREKAKQTLGLPYSMLPDEQLKKTPLNSVVEARTSVIQAWLPVDNLKMKVDGTGNDLAGQGNIAISGKVVFTLKRTDSINVVTIVEDIQNEGVQPVTQGNENKVEKFSHVVDSAFCRGYDICKSYADSSSCRDFVLDYKKLNEYKRIKFDPNGGLDSYIVSGEGLSEYTSSLERHINLKVAGGAKGASFSSETDMTFNVSKKEKAGYKYLTQKDIYYKQTYTVAGHGAPNQLTGFLSPLFLDDLKKLTPVGIIEKYGTHVVLGMRVGTSFYYHMKYRESMLDKSTASTFKNVSSIKYDKEEGGVSKNGVSNEQSKSHDIYQDLKDSNGGKMTMEMLKEINQYYANAKKTTPEQAAENKKKGKGIFFSLESAYEENRASSLLQEDKSTEISCSGHGGDETLLANVSRNNDPATYEKWRASVNESNWCFCDFVPGTLVPIYELIPAGCGCTAQEIRQASEAYQVANSRVAEPLYRDIVYASFDTSGKRNTENAYQDALDQGDKSSDTEIDSKKGKDIYWKLRVELLNFDEDNTCGFSVSIKVFEGGRSGSKTVLFNHKSDVIMKPEGCSRALIDTDKLGKTSVFTAEGDWIGQFHGWQDATSDVRKTASKVFDCDNGVYVMLDGPGDDLDHIGVKGKLIIPIMAY
ncbi:MAG: hypothetical protein IKG81_07400 [Bacteroidales bacterium]|nr:hypothetical protein [Bacteroidales bacterium]